MAGSEEQLPTLMHRGEQAAWSLAALAVALSRQGTRAQQQAARTVLSVMNFDVDGDLGAISRDRASAQAAAPLLQTAAVVNGNADSWAEQSDEALLAQGRASAQGAPIFVQMALPKLAGLTEALDRPGARMLDVGTGVAGLAVGYAEVLPRLTVVGIDVMPRVLALAAQTVAASTVADRVILREQDVATLDDLDVYDLAWLPAPFVPEGPLRTGARAVCRALRPGGWVMLGHGKYGDDPLDDALNRFKTLAFGGTALDDGQAEQLLREAGYTDVGSLPTPPGAPGVTVGRKDPLGGRGPDKG